MKTNPALHPVKARSETNLRFLRSHAGWIICSLALLAGPAARAVTYNFSVDSTAPWFDTGIDIVAVSQLHIKAIGTIQFGPLSVQVADANGGDYDGTQFYPNTVLPAATVVSLIGKIGGTIDPGTGTVLPEGTAGKGPGFVGSSYNQPVFTSGRLFLGYNDMIGLFGDNSGSFAVNLSVELIPEPTALLPCGLALLGFLRRRGSFRRCL